MALGEAAVSVLRRRSFVAKLAGDSPQDRFAQFTGLHDATQTAFLEQMTNTPDRNTSITKM